MTPVPIRNYPELRRALAQRRRQLNFSQEQANDIAGLTTNYLSKIEIGMRNLGYLSLPMTLAALDLDLILVPREEQQ